MVDCMRKQAQNVLKNLSRSKARIAAVTILFGVSAGLLEYAIYTAMVKTSTSELAQAVINALILGIAAAFLPLVILVAARQRQRRVLDDVRKIAKLNHQIRNALQTIVYSEYDATSKEQRKAVLSSVERIDAILREVFPVIGDRIEDKGYQRREIRGVRGYVPSRRMQD